MVQCGLRFSELGLQSFHRRFAISWGLYSHCHVPLWSFGFTSACPIASNHPDMKLVQISAVATLNRKTFIVSLVLVKQAKAAAMSSLVVGLVHLGRGVSGLL